MIQKETKGMNYEKATNLCSEINKITYKATMNKDYETIARVYLAGKNKLQLEGEVLPDVDEEVLYCIENLGATLLDGNYLFVRHPKKGFVSKPNDVKKAIYKHYKQEGRYISAKRAETIYQELVLAAPDKEATKGNFIQFKNGILDLDTMTLKEDDPSIFIPYGIIPHDYKPDAQPVEWVDKVFDQWACGDPLKVDLMFSWIGYNMLSSSPHHCFMIIYGETRNGKSVFCKVIELVLGTNNRTCLRLEDLEKPFKAAALVGKLANISTENEGGSLPELETLKAVTSGDGIPIERKGQDVEEGVCHTKLTFCFNEHFTLEDSSGATKARMLVLLFNASFKNAKDRDPKLDEKLSDEKVIEYIIARSVKAIKEVLDRGEFVLPEDAKEFIEEQDLRDNPIKEFYEFIESGNEVFIEDEDLLIMTDKDFWYNYHSDQIYSVYKYWHKDVMGLPSKPNAKNKFFTCLKKDKKLETYREMNKETNKKITYYRPRIQGLSPQSQLTKSKRPS